MRVKRRVHGGRRNEAVQVACVSAFQRCTVRLFRVRPFSFLVGPLGRRSMCRIVSRLYTYASSRERVFRCQGSRKVRQVTCQRVVCFCDARGAVRVIARRKRGRFQKRVDSMRGEAKSCFLGVRGSFLVGQTCIRYCECSVIEVGGRARLDVDGIGQGQIQKFLLERKRL